MCGLLAFLYKWQTLTGAFLGGVFALLAALLVAWKAERRNDVAAAMHLVSALGAFQGATTQLKVAASGKPNTRETAMWQAHEFARARPKISDMFETYVARVSTLNVWLAAHLSLFLTQHRLLEEKLHRLDIDLEVIERGGTPDRQMQFRVADAEGIIRGMQNCTPHASCSIYMLEKFVLSKWAFWHRFWSRWFQNEKIEECRKILKNPKQQ